MVKLFWNTHNQTKSLTNDKKDAMDHIWGLYHKKNSNIWIYEILAEVKYNVIEDEKNIENEDILIIVDSSIGKKIQQYERLKLICSKIFLFHLGDESGYHNFSTVYDNCKFIWRPFCTSKYFNNAKVKCIPIGYKSGVKIKQKDKRKYKWAFTGTPHKSSRHDLLFQFSEIKHFFCHKTEKFDVKIISVDEMNEVLSSTQFLPCPNGFFHPETYRLYEALECECIPIVENAYNYYDRLFPNNPFIKINKWADTKPMLNGWSENQINIKKKECKNWWREYKNQLQASINKIVNE